ncbi:MAG: phosphoenolpyruvate synthase [Desulfomonile tiedjei]|nr:phosphoenolpyruvate synthase [Desulfomonile tiedjei]
MPGKIADILERIRRWRSGNRGSSRDKVSRVFRFRYACFKDLLASNTELLNIITDFEEKLRGQETFGMSYIRSQATRAVFHALRMVKSLDDLSGHRYPVLFRVVADINQAIKQELGKTKELPLTDWVLPYPLVTKEMVDWVGGKSANLGELLNKVGLPIPEGFAITTRSYEFFLDHNDLVDEINKCRMHLDADNPNTVAAVSEEIQRLIISAPVPTALEDAILSAYGSLVERIRSRDGVADASPRVALRSSAIGEDSELSYAGQYLSVLNVPADRIVETYKLVLASLYTPRAVSYRLNKGMRDEDIAMSVACIEMIDSVASGVAYSRHPFQALTDTILITAVWGLGPYAVDGVITPDSYVVTKDPEFTVMDTTIAHKPVQLASNPHGGLAELPVEPDKQNKASLKQDQIRTLAAYVAKLEKHYEYPQDVEWALDPNGRIVILQTRPLHLEEVAKDGLKAFPVVEGYTVLAEGGAIAFPGVGCGPAFHVQTDEDLVRFPDGAVLLAKHSTPQFVLVMRKAQAIVTDAGSITGHMAALAREFGIPTVLDAKTATKAIAPGTEITVDAYSGRVYQGQVPELMALRKTKESAMLGTPVYETFTRVADWTVPLNLVNPAAANFAPDHCKTLHDVMRFVHELSYREMFGISDLVSDTEGAGSVQLRAPIPLDLHIIDLGGGLEGTSAYTRSVTVDQIACLPFKAILKGMLREDLREKGPRPVDLGGFLAVVREQMLAPANLADRFGDRSYAIISDKYLNFSSRIGYHYSVLDTYCGETVNKNYITFVFKGGAADETRRSRRVRAIAAIFRALDFEVEVREDRVDARFYKYDFDLTQDRLDMVGRLLQFTRQMDMLMQSERSVGLLASSFLAGNYRLDEELLRNLAEESVSTAGGS